MAAPEVLVTRAAPGAEDTAARVRAIGLIPIVSPVLAVRACPIDEAGTPCQAVLFTSANGARFGPEPAAFGDPLALAVGDATAAAARARGYPHVESAQGDAAALIALARLRLRPEAGPVVHVRGVHVARDPLAPLAADGFATRAIVAYKTHSTAELTAQACAFLCSGRRGAVMVHSPKGAQAFLALAQAASVRPADAVTAVAISAAAMRPVAEFFSSQVIVSAPHEELMVDALGRTFAGA